MSLEIRQVVEVLEHRCYDGSEDIYSTELVDRLMGAGDRVIVHTAIGRIDGGTGGSATLTVVAEDSTDGVNWAELSPSLHSATGVSWADLPRTLRGEVPFPHGRFLRLKVTIGGTNPKMWLSMRATIKPNPGE